MEELRAVLAGPERETALFAIRAALIASVGGLLFGYDLGVVAGALPQLEDDFHLTREEKEAVVSLMLAGAVCGAAAGGAFCDYFGRWLSIMAVCVVFVLGAVVLTAAPDLATLLVGRFVVGVAVAVSAIADVAYLTEVSPAKWRGAIVSCNELMITVGLLVAYVVDYVLEDVHEGWRAMFGLSAVFAIVQMAGMYFMPHSPRWLVTQGRLDDARQALRRIYPTEGLVQRELEAIVDHAAVDRRQSDHTQHHLQTSIDGADFATTLDQPAHRACLSADVVSSHNIQAASANGRIKGQSDSTVLTLRAEEAVANELDGEEGILSSDQTRSLKRPLSGSTNSSDIGSNGNTALGAAVVQPEDPGMSGLSEWQLQLVIAIGVMLFQQFSGHANVLNYAPTIFQKAGMGEHTALGAMVIIGIVKVVFTAVAIARIDVVGRKPLLLLGVILCCGGLLILGFSFSMGSASGAVALIGACIFVAAYALGFGPLGWLLTSELFPTSLRGRAIGMATVANWLGNLLVAMTFLSVTHEVGISAVFFGYAAVMGACVAFVLCLVPETKEKQPDEIAAELRRGIGMGMAKDFLLRYFGRYDSLSEGRESELTPDGSPAPMSAMS